MKVRDKISFGAVPCNRVKIKAFDKAKNKFVSQPATFVWLDYSNKADIASVDKAANSWKKADYIKKIATASHFMYANEIDVYALTTQMKDFETLNPEKILGFAEIRLNGSPEKVFLNRLQVKPEAINIYKSKSSHKYVGSSILSSLKKIYTSISLDSADDRNVRTFYRSNGFIENYKDPCKFRWSSNPYTKLKLKLNNIFAKIGI